MMGPSGFLTFGPIAMATVKGKGQPSVHMEFDVIEQDQGACDVMVTTQFSGE